MTKDQININLLAADETPGKLTFLENISSIVLFKNSSLYPSENHQFYFDNVNNLLLEYDYFRDGSTKLSAIYDYSLIIAFIFVSNAHPHNVHRLGVSA